MAVADLHRIILAQIPVLSAVQTPIIVEQILTTVTAPAV